eukprot:403355100
MSKPISRSKEPQPSKQFSLFKCCIKAQESKSNKKQPIKQDLELNLDNSYGLNINKNNAQQISQQLPTFQQQNFTISNGKNIEKNRNIALSRNQSSATNVHEQIVNQEYGQQLSKQVLSEEELKNKRQLDESRASIERSLKEIDLIFSNENNLKNLSNNRRITLQFNGNENLQTVRDSMKSDKDSDNTKREKQSGNNQHINGAYEKDEKSYRTPTLRGGQNSPSPTINTNSLQHIKNSTESIHDIKNENAKPRQNTVEGSSPLLTVRIGNEIERNALTSQKKIDEEEDITDLQEFEENRYQSSQIDVLKKINNKFSERRSLKNHKIQKPPLNKQLNRDSCIQIQAAASQTRDHVSYSIHSINMLKSQNTLTNQFENANMNSNVFQMNPQLYQGLGQNQINYHDQFLRVNDSQMSESNNNSSNAQNSSSQVNDAAKDKIASYSIFSQQSSQNNYYLMGEFGHISPIIKNQGTDTKSLYSMNFDDNLYGSLPKQTSLSSNMQSQKFNFKGTADQQDLINELKRQAIIFPQQQYVQNQVIQVNHAQIIPQQTISSLEFNKEKRSLSKQPFDMSLGGQKIRSAAGSSLSMQQQKAPVVINLAQTQNQQQLHNQLVHSEFYASTLSNTPKGKDIISDQSQSSQPPQIMVPLHLVEAYYAQLLNEKDQTLHKSYNTIAKLSNKIGNLQGKIQEQKQEVKKCQKENLDIRSTLNYVMQAKLLSSDNN